MTVKFAQYFKNGRGSQVAHVLYRDGFMEITSKSPKQVNCMRLWCHDRSSEVIIVSSVFALIIEFYQTVSSTNKNVLSEVVN